VKKRNKKQKSSRKQKLVLQLVTIINKRMKNFTKVITTLLLLLICCLAGFAQSGYKIKSSNGANIRQGAGTDKAIITTIPAGSKVKVLEKTNDNWYKVEYSGKTGYVSSSLIEEDKQNDQSARQSNTTTDRPEQKSNSNDTNHSAAQRKDDSDKPKSNSTSGKKNSSSATASSYKWGIGLRFGDPVGITVKKYTASSAAWEFNLGRSSRWGYNYGNDFYRNSKFDDKRYYRYYGYTGGFSTSLQVHYLLHKPINGAEGLKFYYGGGAQIRFTPITYRYYYDADGSGDWWNEWNYQEERVTDIDLGLDGVLGLEYTFRNAPVSVFLDANLFIELVNSPFLFSGQGGIGVRYNF
jgi:uncharacterized protein YgiM (DUF1202 family)